jgi:hypothetical protein|nr:MAG TPA: hypothetical protein [Caudoviricetes sp.]
MIKTKDGMYKLTLEELRTLLTDSARLEALECGGVDNWFGCEDAFSEYGDIDETVDNWLKGVESE